MRESTYFGSWELPSRGYLLIQGVIGVVYAGATTGLWLAFTAPGSDVGPAWLAVVCGTAFLWGLGQNLYMAFGARPVSWRRRLTLGGLDFTRHRWATLIGVVVFFASNVLAAWIALPPDFASADLEGGRWTAASVAALLSCAAGVAGLIVIAVVVVPVTVLVSIAFPSPPSEVDDGGQTAFERMWPLEKGGFSLAMLSIVGGLAVSVPGAMLDSDDPEFLWCIAGWILAGIGLLVGGSLNNVGVHRRQCAGVYTEFG